MQKTVNGNRWGLSCRLQYRMLRIMKQATRLFHDAIGKKTMMVMKIAALFLLVFCLHVSASTSSQTITLSGKNIPLTKVFTIIEKQTGFLVSGNVDLLKVAQSVTVSANAMPLSSFLQLIFREQPLNFHLEGNDIILVRKFPAETIPSTDFIGVVLPVTGRVIDSSFNPLIGASIRIKGRNNSAVSGNDGRFTINANSSDMLVISYVGFKARELPAEIVQGKDIILAQESTTMEELAINVNTGYQSIPRERATGSYSIISAKRFENKLRPDLRAALEGQAAGLIMSKDGGIEVRGVSTFNAERTPLIIVDGYPITGGLETINVDNVESVTVLKDAVAASIYGTRSSNGVIVVTTRQGKKGVLNAEYRGSVGITLKPDLSYANRASAADYVDAEMALYAASPNSSLNTYNNYGYLSRVNYLMVAKSQGLMTADAVDKEIAQLKMNDGIGQLEKYIFRNQVTQQHNISLSGGNDKNLVSASAKFITNRGNMLYAGDNRLIFDIKNDWKPSKNISIRLLSNINYNTSKTPVRTATELLNYFSNASPYLHPYDLVVNPETGKPQDIYATNPRKTTRYAAIPGLKPMNYNPVSDLGMETTKYQNLQIRMGGSVNVLITDGLNIEAGGTWIRGNAFTRSVYSSNSYRMRLGYNDGTSLSNASRHYIPDGDMMTESRNNNQAYTFRGQLSYNKRMEKHSIMAIAGSEVSRDEFDNNVYPTRFGYNDQAGTFATFNYADYNAGIYNADMLGGSRPQSPVGIGSLTFRDNRFSSWYGNASYEFDRRFLVSGSIRLDQTNFFGTNPDYRYKPLWSAGGTYKLSNEKFFRVPWINKWYMRGSYGINGNISLNSGPFLIITPGVFSNLTGDISYSISSPPNNTLRWEKTGTTNLGTDMSFFSSRLNLTFDYYLRKSRDLLAPDAIDPTLGYSTVTKNVGQINNTGLELTLDGDVIRGRDLTWNAMGTISYNNNKVISYNVNYLFATTLSTVSVNRTGYAANAIFSYRNAGLDKNGAPLYYNAAGALVGGGAVAAGDLVYSGTLRPKYTYSLTNTFRYRNFNLSFMLIAKTGNILRKVVYEGTSYQHKDVGKRWKVPGDEKSTIYPALSGFSLDAFYFPSSDIFAESASFLKLRDASLSYNFNNNLLSRVHLSAASVILQGRNLWMWAANSDQLDPEAIELLDPGSSQAELGRTPFRPRPEYYLGLRLNF